MFLIKDNNPKNANSIVFTQKIIAGSIFINIYLISFALLDIFYLKLAAIENGQFNLADLYIFMAYFVAIQSYSWYNCYNKNKQRLKQISYVNTLIWHLFLLINSLIVGCALSSTNLSIKPLYFILRLTVYAYSIFIVINNLRLIQNTAIRENQLKKNFYQYLNWQLNNFYLIYYASIIGVTFDLLSFGNDLQYKVWLGYICSLILYEFINVMNKVNGWNFFRIIFSSQ